ncbi:MAG: hypothetical protein ACKVS7_13230 [Gemmatimonadaceae bacterium]
MSEQKSSRERPTRVDVLDEIVKPPSQLSELQAHQVSTLDHSPVARRRIGRVARVVLVLAGLGFGLWYWQQVRDEFYDGFRNKSDVRELIRDGVR